RSAEVAHVSDYPERRSAGRGGERRAQWRCTVAESAEDLYRRFPVESCARPRYRAGWTAEAGASVRAPYRRWTEDGRGRECLDGVGRWHRVLLRGRGASGHGAPGREPEQLQLGCGLPWVVHDGAEIGVLREYGDSGNADVLR